MPKRTDAGKLIKYVENFNYKGTCKLCGAEKFDKNVVVSNSASERQTTNEKITHAANFNKGGTIQFGDFYLGKPVIVNYLGRREGMPGGSGMPPVNKF